jgi:hypothetical protein
MVSTDHVLLVAFDWERLDKNDGADVPEGRTALLLRHDPVHGGAQSLVEHRLTATLAWTVHPRFTAVARIPWSARRLVSGGTAVENSGLSDPEFFALARVWSRAELTDHFNSVTLQFGVKTDWGRNDVAVAGERVAEHLQSGTGAVDVMAGASVVRILGRGATLFGSLQHRWTGRNDYGYAYGRAILANLSVERRLGDRVSTTMSLNFRDAATDRDVAHDMADTGGRVLYLTPGLLARIGNGVVVRASVQIPIAEDLDGRQDERVVANAGVSRSF